MARDIAFLLISFLVIIVGAELFTNGIEWLGVRLRLSEGAVGSVLAAVGTALPETLIPVVALVFLRTPDSHEIGLGAILGAPFMLATLAFFVTALSAWAYRRRRQTGWRLSVNRQILARDLGAFIPLYAAAIAISFAPERHWSRPAAAIALLLAYAYYAYVNLRESEQGEKQEPLMLHVFWSALPLPPWLDSDGRRTRRERVCLTVPRLRLIASQVLIALGLIVAGAFIFVDAISQLALAVGFPPLVIALVVAPIATELPEKLNSVIWVRHGKDTLALGNITGAMVFQSTIPVTLGILLTTWHFGFTPVGRTALLSAAIALLSALIVLVTARTGRSPTMSPWSLAVGLVWWLVFLAFTLATVIL